MNGNNAYEEKIQKQINQILTNYPDLKGFYYFITDLSLATVYDYLNYITNFMDFVEDDFPCLKVEHFTFYLNQYKKKSSSYQIAIYSALKKFSTYLYVSEKINKDIMLYIKRPKFKESQTTKMKREKGFLEEHEIKEYLSTVKTGAGTKTAIARQKQWYDRDMAIILLFLNTGIRCSALYKLDVNSIDFDKKMLTTVEKGEDVVSISLSDELLSQLVVWLDKRQKILGDKKEDALFISNQKRRMDQSSISRIVRKYAQIEGKHITPHKLRATYGTQLYSHTKDLYFVQKNMRHSDPKITQIYIRGQNDNMQKKAATIMSELTIKY